MLVSPRAEGEGMPTRAQPAPFSVGDRVQELQHRTAVGRHGPGNVAQRHQRRPARAPRLFAPPRDNSPPRFIDWRIVRRQSGPRAVDVGRGGGGFSEAVQQGSAAQMMRRASAISATDICSKSSVFNRSSRLMVSVASISDLGTLPPPRASRAGHGRRRCSNASAARFSAARAARSSATPCTAGISSDIMCSR